jgi:multiple sugar transport system substrate-binding protein
MWSPLTGPDGDEMSDIAARFSQENAWGITVNHVPQPDYMRSLTTPGQRPAMSIVRVINIGELAARNVLKPLSADMMSTIGLTESDFPESAWSRGEYNGQRYSIPLDSSPLVLYYNKDMFNAAGVPLPGTTPMTADEFQNAFDKIKASGKQPISIGTAFQAGVLFHTLIYQYGGALTSEDGSQVTFNSPQGLQALQTLQKLRTDSGSTASGTGDPEVQEFSSGQSAMVIHGPWHISNLNKLAFTGFAPVPQWGSQYAVWGSSHQFAITTDDPAQQAAAACWIRWMSDNSVAWAAAGQAPARNSVRDDPSLATNAPEIAAVAGSASSVVILPQVPALESAVWGQGYGPAVDAVLLGEQTDLQAALDGAQQTSQQLVDDNAEQFASPAP